jgi:thiol-disulfide isomerase/thioredoxin
MIADSISIAKQLILVTIACLLFRGCLSVAIAEEPTSRPILITAPWCGPCKAIEAKYPDAILIDADKAPDHPIIKRYNIQRIPTLIIDNAPVEPHKLK